MTGSKTPPKFDLDSIKSRVGRPKKAIVTAGMPYANGPLHLGHLAGAHIPADIHARWMKMLIGEENVLYVCGTDDHGSTTELGAIKSGLSTREHLDKINHEQKNTLARYNVGLDVYSGTSKPECFSIHEKIAQDFMRRMHKNGLLEKRASMQWYDPKMKRFLQDRFVSGHCPNPHCENEGAYSDECDACGAKYRPDELVNPKSSISDATPELRETKHLWLDMWSTSEVLREWILTKKKSWRKPVYNEVIYTVMPAIEFDRVHEDAYKALKAELPKHKSRYAPGKKQVLQFETKPDMDAGRVALKNIQIETSLVDGWAHRSLTRDVAWGVPVPDDIDPELAGKTLYVWPESLMAPIAFTQVALEKKGLNKDTYKEYWNSKDSKIYQFLGQDNVYFYVLMQASMWVAAQVDTTRPPVDGELQFTEVFGCQHLQIAGEKMSKSTGNNLMGDQLLDDYPYTADQIRYYLATLNLIDNPSNFQFESLDERNRFLAGPLNASFEKPISACHSKFGGKIPDGTLNEKVETETLKIIQRYLSSMEKANYVVMLGAIENYARLINSMFTQFKPHDDRFPEQERKDALFSCFSILKNIMIMLSPFVPDTMSRLRESLNLPESVLSIDELGIPMQAGHVVGEQQEYFPAVEAKVE